MPELNALYLALVVALVVAVTARLKLMPFLALTGGTALYGVLVGSSLPWVAKEFSMGFGQTLAAAGLTVAAAAMLCEAFARSGGALWLRPHLSLPKALAAGSLAGLGGTPLSALAVMSPLIEIAGRGRTRIGLAAAHAVTATHGCLLPSPLPIAALAILGGDWHWALAVGLPVALVQILVGLTLARRVEPDPEPERAEECHATPPLSRRAALGGLLGVLMMIGLIIGHSLGQIPSEPFGGGNTRENILGLGRPMLLLLLGLGSSLAIMGALSRKALDETGWLAEGGRNASGLMLAVGAAGGLQMALYDTGMAPLLAERLQALPPSLGPAIPFLMALVCRALQGSALTAAITAAGIMQPLLVPLGLTGGPGIALAVVAVGSGAMAAPHINDGFFWLAAHQTRLSATRALIRVTGGCLIQGLAGMATLMLLARILPR